MKSFIKNFLLLKELPQGMLLLFALLSFLAGYLWDQKVIHVSTEQNEIENVDEWLNEGVNSGIKYKLNNCARFTDKKAYAYSFLLENISLNGSTVDSIKLEFLSKQPIDVMIAGIKTTIKNGMLKPSTKVENNCAELIKLTVEDLKPGSEIRINLLSTSATAPKFYSTYMSDEIKIENEFSFHSVLQVFSQNFNSILIAIVLLILFYLIFLVKEQTKAMTKNQRKK